MNSYQKEHFEAFRMVMDYLAAHPAAERHCLADLSKNYLDFRKRLDAFQQSHVGEFCARKCYRSNLSACCSRDSIVVYFADVVVNCIRSTASEIRQLMNVLLESNAGHRCVYLTPTGCRWHVSPIVCAMFLCEEAEACLGERSESAAEQWRVLELERKGFTWPDRPVFFDAVERRFLDAGRSSSLMHLNSSPGLLMIKRKAGLTFRPPQK